MIRPGILCLFVLFSCTSGPQWKETIIQSRISLLLPEDMPLSSAPNPHALVHYEDTMKSIFLMVIEESKDSMKAYEMDYNLSTYFDQVSKDIASRLSGASIKGVHAEKLNGNDAFLGNINGTAGSVQVEYLIAGIETPGKFYQVISAYPAKDSLKSRPYMEKILRSFSEL